MNFLLLSRKTIAQLFAAFIVVELLSFFAHTVTSAQLPLSICILVVAAIVAWKNPLAGIGIQLVELILGSKGYLFYLSIGVFSLSIRIALFIALFGVMLAQMIRDKRVRFFSFPYWKQITALYCVVALGVVIALVRGNSFGTLFFDANGYIYLAWMIPVTQAVRTREEWQRLFEIGLLATVWVMLKTILVLFCFSQPGIFGPVLLPLYTWLRRSGVGEITPAGNGFTRVFFQNQIYVLQCVIASIPLAVMLLEKKLPNRRVLIQFSALLIVAMSVVFMSYSRSFWFAAVVATAMTSVLLMIDGRSWKRLRALLLTGVLFGLSAIAGYGILLGVVNLEIPGYPKSGAYNLLTDRLGNVSGESAAASRWQQLPPLKAAILEHPVLGSGLGRTVTYISNDPRVRQQSPDGTYTTYAFEWGYLDFLLKFGGLLCLVVLGILGSIARDIWQYRNNDIVLQAVAVGFVAVAAVHVFTPYLNHPLGFGYGILLLSLLSFVKRPVVE